MGSSNFFSKLASIDPLAQALNLPGAGVTPTLAGANANYVPGGPGATVGWTPTQATAPGNSMFSFLQKNANVSGNATPHLNGPGTMPTTPNVSSKNPYVQASQGWG